MDLKSLVTLLLKSCKTYYKLQSYTRYHSMGHEQEDLGMPVIFMMLATMTCSVVMEIQSLGYYLKGKASLRYPKPLTK